MRKVEVQSERPRVFAGIGEWKGKPAGFALCFYNFSTFSGRHGIYLEDLFVRPRLRGHGLGKALLRRLAGRCVEEGLARCMMHGGGGEFRVRGVFFDRRQVLKQHDRPPGALPERRFQELVLKPFLRLAAA